MCQWTWPSQQQKQCQICANARRVPVPNWLTTNSAYMGSAGFRVFGYFDHVFVRFFVCLKINNNIKYKATQLTTN